jgi:ACT domain-containing protein
MKAENKIIQHKLSVLQLAEALGNITQACKQRGVSRTQFYEYKRRFQTHGMEGLRDLYNGLKKLDRNFVTLKFLSHEKIKKKI